MPQGSGGGKGGAQPQNPTNIPVQGSNVFDQSAAGLSSAMGGAQAGQYYQPMQINAGDVGRQTMAYMNPYENQVVQNTMADMERQRQIQQNQIGAQATAARAFGGSRQALMQSEADRNALQTMGNTAAQLRQAGWQQGQNLAGQAALANQQAGLSGAQQRLNASTQLGNLANLGFGMGQAAQQMEMQSGGLAQGINQMLIDAAKQQYAGYTGAPTTSLGYMAQALGATPTPQTTTQSMQPGLFDYLTLAATAGSKIK
jgi:hypothetical protein